MTKLQPKTSTTIAGTTASTAVPVKIPDWFELVIRDVCELDSENPDAADTVCIRPLDLRLIMERHAAPPAPAAVPFDAVRELLMRRMAQWRSHIPANPDTPGTRAIETTGETDYNNDVAIWRQGIAVMDEALALLATHHQSAAAGGDA